MCLGMPGQIVEVLDGAKSIVRVDVAGVRRSISTAVLDQAGDPARIGDWVIIHAGFALSKVDEEEARETYRFLQELGEAGAGDSDGRLWEEVEPPMREEVGA